MTQAILSLFTTKIGALSDGVERWVKIYVYKRAVLWYNTTISVR